MLPDELTTRRLRLVRWGEEHLPELMAAVETSLDELRLWMPWAQDMPTWDAERAVIARSQDLFETGQDFSYFLLEAETGELVGGAALHRTAAGSAEIGYWVRSDRHRLGYASEAAGRLVSAAFDFLDDIALVEIRMDKANVASARVPEKLGFRLAGEDTARERLAIGHTGHGWIWEIDREAWTRRRIG